MAIRQTTKARALHDVLQTTPSLRTAPSTQIGSAVTQQIQANPTQYPPRQLMQQTQMSGTQQPDRSITPPFSMDALGKMSQQILQNKYGRTSPQEDPYKTIAGYAVHGLTKLPENLATTPGFAGLRLNQARRLQSLEESGLKEMYQGAMKGFEGQGKQQRELIESSKPFTAGDITYQLQNGKYVPIDQKEKESGIQFVKAEYNELGDLLSPPSYFDKATRTLTPITGSKAIEQAQGSKAQGGFSSSYPSLTVDQALRLWSGKGYGDEIIPELRGKIIGQLSDDEMNVLIQRMADKGEGGFGKDLKGRSTRNNNPGNIKIPAAGIEEAKRRYGDPGVSIDPKPALDGGYFLKFSNPNIGWNAMRVLLRGEGAPSGIPQDKQLGQQQYTSEQVMTFLNNLPITNKIERLGLQKNVDAALGRGDTEGAMNVIKTKARQQLPVGIQEKLNDFSHGAEAYGQVLQFIDDNNLSTGPYKELLEDTKPYTLIGKDPKYAELKQLIGLAEAPVRRGFFGTAVSSGEQGTALTFLLNPNDPINIIRQKIQNSYNFFKYIDDVTIATSLGMPKPKLTDYLKQSSSQQGAGIISTPDGLKWKQNPDGTYSQV